MNIENFNGFEFKIHTKEVIEETSEELASNIKRSSSSNFGGTGAYANGWTFKVVQEGLDYKGVVYNQDHYQLTHLLENGHLIKNAYGSYGRIAPRQHIKPEFDKIKDVYVKRMSECDIDIKEL